MGCNCPAWDSFWAKPGLCIPVNFIARLSRSSGFHLQEAPRPCQSFSSGSLFTEVLTVWLWLTLLPIKRLAARAKGLPDSWATRKALYLVLPGRCCHQLSLICHPLNIPCHTTPCVRVCAQVCEHTCTSKHVCNVFLFPLQPNFLKQAVSLSLEVTHLARLSCSKSQGCTWSCLHGARTQAHVTSRGF